MHEGQAVIALADTLLSCAHQLLSPIEQLMTTKEQLREGKLVSCSHVVALLPIYYIEENITDVIKS